MWHMSACVCVCVCVSCVTSQVHYDCIYRGIDVVSSRSARLLGGNRTIAEVNDTHTHTHTHTHTQRQRCIHVKKTPYVLKVWSLGCDTRVCLWACARAEEREAQRCQKDALSLFDAAIHTKSMYMALPNALCSASVHVCA